MTPAGARRPAAPPADPDRWVLIDSSSAILLFKAGWLEAAARAWPLGIAAAVGRELTALPRPGASDFAAMMDAGRLRILRPPEATDLDPALASMGAGERDTLRLFRSGAGAFVILDDRRGAGFCRSWRIPHVNALLVPRILALSGAEVPGDWSAAMDELIRLGRYAEAVRRYARACPDNRLEAFRPPAKRGPMGASLD